MTDFEIYAGEDFALLMSATTDDDSTPEDLSNYDIMAQLSTTSLGSKIIASTADSAEIVIVRKGISNLAVNISNKLTSFLSEGVLILSVMMTHKQTAIQIIAETKTINIKRSKIVAL